MKRLPLILIALVLLAMLGVAPASALTIGTLSNGTGTATLIGGQLTVYSFSGAYHFDNTVEYPIPGVGNQTLAQIFSDGGQYSFAANTDGSLHAGDAKYLNPTLDKGSSKWGIYGTNNGTTFYGQAMTLAFSGGTSVGASGSATGVFNSDGFIHWYYGYDGDPGGKTSMAAYGLPAASYFLGQYEITSTNGSNINFKINGEFIPTPLPGTVVLLGSGLAGLAFWRRRLVSKS
jgi:hypothetical protein